METAQFNRRDRINIALTTIQETGNRCLVWGFALGYLFEPWPDVVVSVLRFAAGLLQASHSV